MRKEIQRQVHLDFHTSEFIENIAKDFNGADFARTVKDSYINSITAFARCHHGWLYYPSKKHPHLIHPNLQNKNLLVEQIDSCHKLNIKVPIYTTVQWDGRIMRDFPQWLAIDENGDYINTQNIPDPHFYNTICLNSPYREFFKEHLLDIIETLGSERIDGFFLDILFKVDCNCEYCKEAMVKLNMDTESKNERLKYSAIMLDDFRREISAFLENYVPNKTIFFNSSHVGPNFKNALDVYSHLELESLPSGGWGYDHFPATVRYARNLGKPIFGMTGKFHTYWGDFHSFKNENALEFECFNMLTLGVGCSIGDQLHPNGRLSKGTYELIGKVYKKVNEKEKYCIDATPICEIAILTPEEFYKPNEGGLSPSLIGAMRALQEMSYQFNIIDSSMDFSKYKLLILPDTIYYNKNLKDKLKKYMENGGHVIGSYMSMIDIENKDNLFSLKYLGESPFHRSFILPNEILGRTLPKEEHVMYLKGISIEKTTSKVILNTINPYFNRQGKYFCSHQHSPSSGEIGDPGAIYEKNYIYFSHPIFNIYRKNGAKWCKEIFKDAINIFIKDKLVCHSGPSTVITSLNEQIKENRILLHLLNYFIEKPSQDIYTIEDKIDLRDIDFKLNINGGKVQSIFKENSKESIPFFENNGYIEFSLDKISGHEIIIINK